MLPVALAPPCRSLARSHRARSLAGSGQFACAHGACAACVSTILATMLSPDLTEAVLDEARALGPAAPDRAGLDRIYGAWCRRRAVRQPREADPPRERVGGADPQRPARGVLRVVAARTAPAAPAGRARAGCTRCSSRSASTPGGGRPRCSTTSPGRSTRTARRSCASTASTTGSTRRCSPNVALPLVPHEATRHDDPVSPVWSEPVDDLWRVWWTSAVERRGDRLPPPRRRRERRALPRRATKRRAT